MPCYCQLDSPDLGIIPLGPETSSRIREECNLEGVACLILPGCCSLWSSRCSCRWRGWRGFARCLMQIPDGLWRNGEARGQASICMCKFFLSCHLRQQLSHPKVSRSFILWPHLPTTPQLAFFLQTQASWCAPSLKNPGPPLGHYLSSPTRISLIKAEHPV